jgi:c-di-GMP-binding flagellar brake protein YcgR
MAGERRWTAVGLDERAARRHTPAMDAAERRIYDRYDAPPRARVDLDPSPHAAFEPVLRADLVDVSVGGIGVELGSTLAPNLGEVLKISVDDGPVRQAKVAWRRAAGDGLVRVGLTYLT